jgi:hypothetical protein
VGIKGVNRRITFRDSEFRFEGLEDVALDGRLGEEFGLGECVFEEF